MAGRRAVRTPPPSLWTASQISPRTCSPSHPLSHSHKAPKPPPGTPGLARPHCTQHSTPGGQGRGPGDHRGREGRSPPRKGLKGRQCHGGSRAFGLLRPEGFGRMSGGGVHRLQAAAGVRGNSEFRARRDAAPRGGWSWARSRSPLLTSASCWCVPRRRRSLAGPGKGPAPGPQSCNPVAPASPPQRPVRVTHSS